MVAGSKDLEPCWVGDCYPSLLTARVTFFVFGLRMSLNLNSISTSILPPYRCLFLLTKLRGGFPRLSRIVTYKSPLPGADFPHLKKEVVIIRSLQGNLYYSQTNLLQPAHIIGMPQKQFQPWIIQKSKHKNINY